MPHAFLRYATGAIVAAFTLLSVGCGVVLWSAFAAANAPTLPALAQSADGTVGVPVRLAIPRLGLDAAFETVGLKADGSMDTPQDPMHVAWFGFGPRPGQRGSAAVAGHVNWWFGGAGVFANLSTVQPGDVVTVTDDAGVTRSFVVRALHIYDANNDATDVFASADAGTHLNLITCNGVWDSRAQQYTKRLVVFTDLVSE